MTAVATEPNGAATAPAGAELSVLPAERPDGGSVPSSLSGANRWVALVAAFVLHVAILAPLWLQFEWTPRAPPQPEAVPVEIVVEPPPTPQPSPTRDASPPKPPIDLEPAHDAPKAATDEKAELREGTNAKKNAEKGAAGPAANRRETGVERPAKPAEPAPTTRRKPRTTASR